MASSIKIAPCRPLISSDLFRGSIAGSLNLLLEDTLPNQGINLECAIYKETIVRAEQVFVRGNLTNPQIEFIYKGILKAIFENWAVSGGIEEQIRIHKKNAGWANDHSRDSTYASKIAKMRAWDMKPSVWVDVNADLDKENIREMPEEVAQTDTKQCDVCGSRQTKVDVVQTRGADEEATQFVKCLDCGTRWRDN